MHLARAEGSPGFQKLVALKRIHPHLAREQEYVDMFLDEARIASSITHPNVCSVFDFGEARIELRGATLVRGDLATACDIPASPFSFLIALPDSARVRDRYLDYSDKRMTLIRLEIGAWASDKAERVILCGPSQFDRKPSP